MIQDQIAQIELKLREAGNLSEESRNELLALTASLKSELGILSKTHEGEAASIARLADLSAHVATGAEKEPGSSEAARSGLTSSVEGFETSHPELVATVNRIAVILSNMGM